MDPQTLAIAALGIALGGFLKGATGAGAPVVGVPVMAVVYDVQTAVAIFSVLNLWSNIWQSWAYRTEAPDRAFVWRFAVTGALGAMVGSFLLAWLPTEVPMAGLAAIVFAYIGLRLARPDWQLARDTGRKMVDSLGFVGGVMQGAGGVSAPVSVTYLNAMRLPRAEFIGTISVYFMSMSVLQIPALAGLGILTWDRFLASFVAAIPLFGAIPLGSWAAKHLSKQAFDRMILWLLAAIAVKLLWDAVL